jgi:phosphoserine aminotransferase
LLIAIVFKHNKEKAMRDVFNFSPGPAMLPEEVMRKAQEEMLNWHGLGISVMELNHRSGYFMKLAEQIEANLRTLLAIPAHYHVLFIAGGASQQFAMVPLNLLANNKLAYYVDTGVWSKKAIAEAKRYGDIHIASTTAFRDGLAYIPAIESWDLSKNAAYLHYTPNETIEGLEFQWVPKPNNIPLVADMTSMVLSRPINIEDYGIIYAGAQKNLSQAGITLVIIRDDLIHHPIDFTPTLLQYKTYADNQSLYNTPPTYAWYLAGLVIEWMLNNGGIASVYQTNLRKAQKLYSIIDQYPAFYLNKVAPECRSLMNVVFHIANDDLTPTFLTEAQAHGLVFLKGHRVSGGIRASIYNAMPEQGVNQLAEFMLAFIKRYG